MPQTIQGVLQPSRGERSTRRNVHELFPVRGKAFDYGSGLKNFLIYDGKLRTLGYEFPSVEEHNMR